MSLRRGGDCRTQIALNSIATLVPTVDVWRRVFNALDPLYRSFPDEGLLIVAVLAGQAIESHLYVALPEGEAPEFVVLGRHSQCDLRLGSDSSISLRHMVVSATRRGCELYVRLSDLGTEIGMKTEDGQRCEGLATEGAAFVSIGAYHLFFLPTGSLSPLPWGVSAEDAWAAIPERVYADRRASRSMQNQLRRVRLIEAEDRRSIVTQIIDPPTALRERRPEPGARGPLVGALTLETAQAREIYDVFDHDLGRGLLIGRYDRCTLGSEDERLSRVHLLLVRDGNALWAVDTASSNGTTTGARLGRIRQLCLSSGAELSLGRAIKLTWSTPATVIPGPVQAEAPAANQVPDLGQTVGELVD
jgi:hypothetical protein